MNALRKLETNATQPRKSLELVQIEGIKRIGFIQRCLNFFKPADFSQRDWEQIETRNHRPTTGDDAYQRHFANKRGGL